jgi:hypothetical protein
MAPMGILSRCIAWAWKRWGDWQSFQALGDLFDIKTAIFSLFGAVVTLLLAIFSGWSWIAIWLSALAAGALISLIGICVKWIFFHRDADYAPRDELEIYFRQGQPYEVIEILHGHVLSTVRIGLKSRIPISNCKIYIEKIAPEPPLYGSLPILLDGGGFVVRSDDPEKLVDIATQWDHHGSKFRFNSPITGMFAETLGFIDDDIPRTIEIKIISTELQKTALFKIWTDNTKKLHLERA